MSNIPVIVWFRRDLRLADQPALAAACKTGRPVIPLYLYAPDEEAPWAPGAASQWWLHHSLCALQKDLEKKQALLILRKGPAQKALNALMEETGADTVYWNRCYEPALIERDARIQSDLRARGITVKSFNSALLFEPWDIENKSGNPFQVFTPFWKQCCAQPEPSDPLPAPGKIPAPKQQPASDPLDSFELLPDIPWDKGFYEVWEPGAAGAAKQLDRFLEGIVDDYDHARDLPGVRGTSRLSPYLHAGDIGPRQIWHAVQQTVAQHARKGLVKGSETYLREVGWREFAHHLLYHFPNTPEQPLRREFSDFPWLSDAPGLKAWQTGQTGYPIVDAGMRELWHTGWMHNRVRMIVASFLVKDLLIPWQEGARWFWDTLVDANLANNTLGWQWTAGCGADAAPYFRIFNPVLQGRKFDPDGTYVRRWVPELAPLPDKLLHNPWDADPATLQAANITLGKTYPHPIVDHQQARNRALNALSEIKKE